MSAVGEIDGVAARRHYVLGLSTEYLDGTLAPDLRFIVEDTLERDPTMAAHFQSLERSIAIARETVRRRFPLRESQRSNLLAFLRDNAGKS